MKQKFVVNAIRQLILNGTQRNCELVNFLVSATSIEEAEKLVENTIKAHEKEFINSNGEKGVWKYVEILSTNPIISETEEITELQVQVYENLEALRNFEKARSFSND